MRELSEKDRLLQEALRIVEKEYGKGSLMMLGEHVAFSKEIIRTGSLYLDRALGIGGYPKGKVIEVYGDESSGKTTIMLHAIAECQKDGGTCAFIDVEHALDPSYAEELGVDIQHLFLAQPDNGEEALGICETLVESRAFDLVIVDSAAALVPKEELDGKIGDDCAGLQTGMIAKSLRNLVESTTRTRATVIFTNQLRYKEGSTGYAEVAPGGRALKFHAAVRIEVKNISPIKNRSSIIGEKVCLTVKKNKLAPPFKKADISILFGEGISKEDEVIDLGVEYGVLSLSGTWYSYGNAKIAQGRDNAKKYFSEHLEVMEEISAKVFELM